MKKIIYLTLTFLFVAISTNIYAQRLVKGTVYDTEGKPAAGVEVSAHKTANSYFTSFDGKYEIDIPEKAKWIKFTFIDDVRKHEFVGPSNDIDFFFGKKALKDAEKEISLLGAEDLLKKNDEDYMNHVTYTDFCGHEKYEEAYPNWHYIFKYYPKSTKNIYIHGIRLLENLAKKATDKEEKKKYVDELMNLYDQRIKYYNQKEIFLGDKGMKLREVDRKRVEEAYKYIKEAVELSKEKASNALLVNFMKVSTDMFNMGKAVAEITINDYGTVKNIFDKKLADAKTDEEKDEVRNALKNAVNIFINTPGLASCDNLVPIYEKEFQDKSNDTLFLRDATKKLRDMECLDNPIFEKMAVKLYELEKSSAAAYNIAKAFLIKKDYGKSQEWYNRAIESALTEDEKADYYYELAAVMQAKKNYSKCRQYALEAVKYRKSWGKPYMLIGDTYVASYKTCGNEFEQATVFWAAVDKYAKAKSIDPSIAAEANKSIANYSKYFPDKSEAFMRGLIEGKSFKVGCWINETTTIRF